MRTEVAAPPRIGFIGAREVPPEWQADLESVVPRSGRVNWLRLVWQPGMLYEPVQRWEVYELVPALDTVPAEILDALRGPDPREVGVWVPDPNIPEALGGRRWISDSLVSRVQWQLYRETGCYAQRFWIIQGTRGGHKWKLSQAERNYLAAFAEFFPGETPETPAPGDLPYAEWDQRVKAKMVEHDRLRRWRNATAWDERGLTKTEAGLWVRADRYDAEKVYAARMLKWLEDQVADVVSDIPRRLLPGPSDLPRGDGHYNEDEEQLDRRLVEITASAPPDTEERMR